jgi:DNA-binding transcriptional LysR family regulator
MQDLKHLWHFVQVAEAGTFTAAAKRLSLSTAALSKSIARLEGRIGVPLFVRTSKSLQLTDEGRALFESADGALRTIQTSLESVRGTTNEPAGIIRLSTVTAYGKHCILPVLPAFFARYPQIQLIISFHDGGRGLSRQAFDVRVNWGEDQEQDKVTQTLCSMPLILVASPGYLAQRGVPRTPQDLEKHDCINVAMPSGSRAHWTFIPRSGAKKNLITIAPKGQLVVMDELDAVTNAAACGLGITVSSAENVLPALRAGRLVRVLEGYSIQAGSPKATQIIIQYSRKATLPLKVRLLVNFLLENLKGRDPLELVAAANPYNGETGGTAALGT